MLREVEIALRDLPAANPSSLHAEGRAARAALDLARDRAAAALGVPAARELVFCSGGTEAVNLALLGAGRRLPAGARVVTWAAEHQSVLEAVRRLQLEGRPVTILPVDGAARADPLAIPPDAGLVSIGLANNELGTLQPVREIAAEAHRLGAIVHVDACQGPSWVDPCAAEADLVSFSGHKIGAGGGGLLRVASGTSLEPVIHGGPQERSRRAGREDLRGAVAISVALAASAARRAEAAAAAAPRARRLREAMVEAGGELTGQEPRLPNFATCVFPGRRGEDLLLALDLAGIAASSGSACASGSLDPSHVLLAAGYPLDAALAGLRLTISYLTTDPEIDGAAAALRRLGDRSPVAPTGALDG